MTLSGYYKAVVMFEVQPTLTWAAEKACHTCICPKFQPYLQRYTIKSI